MMNTKTRKPKGARSLAVTLAIAFFALSVVILLINGALAGFSNYSNVQETNSKPQQIVAQDAAKIVASSIEEKFTGLETVVGFANPVTLPLHERPLWRAYWATIRLSGSSLC